MTKRFIDYNADGSHVYQHYDHSTHTKVIETIQDVEPILDMNATRAEYLDKKKDWWFVGTVPNVVLMQWSKECGARIFSKEFREYARKQLNKADYSKLNPNRIRV